MDLLKKFYSMDLLNWFYSIVNPGPVVNELYLQQISDARQDLIEFFAKPETHKGAPAMMLRFAWNDAGTYDAIRKTGGANASIMNSPLVKSFAIAELAKASQECARLKDNYPKLTYADIIQLAGVVAVKVTGGPEIDFVPGRKDSRASPEPGRLPAEKGGKLLVPYDMATFFQMGLSAEDSVPLTGGLYLGIKEQLQYNCDDILQINDDLTFDNSYFRTLVDWEKSGGTTFHFQISHWDKPFVELDRDVIYPLVERYAEDQDAFFRDYAKSHKKFSELGFTPKKSTTRLMPRFLPPAISTSMVVLGLCYFFKFHRRV